MSPQAQQIAVAEACGFKEVKTHFSAYLNREKITGLNLSGVRVETPDYLNDLEGIRGAVSLRVEEHGFPFQESYVRELRAVVTRRRRDCNEMQVDFWMAEADLAQRVEAFIRAIGEWKGTP